MIILGINSAYHEPSACLIREGKIIAAVEEERFNRIRHGKPANLLNPHHIPEKSIEYCLKIAGIIPREIDFIGYSFIPEIRFNKNVNIDKEFIEGGAGSQNGEEIFYYLNKAVPDKISRFLGHDIKDRFIFIEHHLCHASSAFLVSPYKEATILSVDGIGEFETIWIGKGNDNKIIKLKSVNYPNSLGLLWAKFSEFLGFGEYGQWKVMGLSAYGNYEKYYRKFLNFISFDNHGNFSVDNDIVNFRGNNFNSLEEIFGKHRKPEGVIWETHKDIAAALQKITNDIMLCFTQYAFKLTGCNKLVIAGGVGLNCVANNYINENGPFDEIFIQPAANDAGTALGACYYLWNHVNEKTERIILENVYLGTEYTTKEIDTVLSSFNIKSTTHQNIEQAVAKVISEGEIVAWFRGRMEFGPRALGNRSILADPRRFDIPQYLNDKIKHRELFRPFAASVLSENVNEWFEMGKPSLSDRFMLLSRKVIKSKLGKIQAVTHYDNSCRIQIVYKEDNPVFYSLIKEFNKLTGVPLLLNTSFNDSEPIICSPQDALNTCIQSKIRWLVLNDYLIDLRDIISPFKTISESKFVSEEIETTHSAKHIVRSHKPTLKPKPAKELACFACTDFADTKKTKSFLTLK